MRTLAVEAAIATEMVFAMAAEKAPDNATATTEALAATAPESAPVDDHRLALVMGSVDPMGCALAD